MQEAHKAPEPLLCPAALGGAPPPTWAPFRWCQMISHPCSHCVICPSDRQPPTQARFTPHPTTSGAYGWSSIKAEQQVRVSADCSGDKGEQVRAGTVGVQGPRVGRSHRPPGLPLLSSQSGAMLSIWHEAQTHGRHTATGTTCVCCPKCRGLTCAEPSPVRVLGT